MESTNTPLLPSSPTTLESLSSLLGWAYFICWSLSAYPQFWLNYSHRSVAGVSIDFVVMNCEGMLFLAIYTAAFYGNQDVRQQYRDRNGGEDNLVTLADVVFAVHATFWSYVTLLQFFLYHPQIPRPHPIVTSFLVVTLLPALGLLVATFAESAQAIDVLYYLSYVKLATVVVKCVPQVLHNWRRESTVGWSIEGVLLDLAGGLFSLAQLLLDALSTGSGWRGILGDPVKLFLGILSVFFDVVFAVQHYVSFPEPKADEEVVVPEDDGDVESAAATRRKGRDGVVDERTALLV
ncbi:hypothetical protein M427DRAFT_118527 [Gonapodya prolifera JEL478]|uniref:PQ-loop-domain-containing protein n=1 Tax=Gonapodya prolifera (strain JEL478) TaxID=1344416 RepID=A0A139B189_GONPJ|nr:hypothetical protein M427DRAFT_118527 [Gonapodya prolifera JEL478]|eukprot:KXS22563.1 hypothetical protein M427DRAFT_118527 [Gonapodya prolifera JEL478]